VLRPIERVIWAVLAAVLSLCSLFAALEAQNARSPTFTSHSDLVVLRIGVFDRRRGPVSGLTKDDFIVYEDGRPQPISFFSHEDLPVTVGLVIDNSGSMGPKRDRVVTAALAFVRSSRPDDEVFIVNFNEKVWDPLPADAPFTSNLTVLRSTLIRIGARGKTALFDGISHALDYLERGHHDQKVLVVLSDGGDNASLTTFDQLKAKATKSNAIIYAVGLFEKNDPDANPRVLKRLAGISGGDAFIPDSLQDVVSILERIATEIRTAYIVGYVPTNTSSDRLFRRLRVSVQRHGGNIHVRHREGYVPG